MLCFVSLNARKRKGYDITSRHDISDQAWASLAPHLPGKKGFVGRPTADSCLFINAVFWILRTEELHGETSLLTIDTLRILIGGFVDGEIKAYGKLCSKSESIPPDFEWILN